MASMKDVVAALGASAPGKSRRTCVEEDIAEEKLAKYEKN
jgi:hypothetical protein